MSSENTIRIKIGDFGIRHLRQHPVWTWSQDLYEREDSLVPVPVTREGLADPTSLIIHAIFRTASGKRLEGSIVYNPESDEVFAMGFFYNDDEFSLNKYLPDLSREELERYCRAAGERIETILPIRFEIVPKKIPIEPAEFAL